MAEHTPAKKKAYNTSRKCKTLSFLPTHSAISAHTRAALADDSYDDRSGEDSHDSEEENLAPAPKTSRRPSGSKSSSKSSSGQKAKKPRRVSGNSRSDDNSVQSPADSEHPRKKSKHPKQQSGKMPKSNKELAKEIAALSKKLTSVTAENSSLKTENSTYETRIDVLQGNLAETKEAMSASSIVNPDMRSDQMVTLAFSGMKNVAFRTIKFIQDPAQEAAASKMVLESLDLPEYKGTGPEIEAKRQEWYALYKADVRKGLNDARTYVGSQVKVPIMEWINAHDGMLPTKEDFEKVVKRDIPADCDDKHPLMELFTWYWDKFLPLIAHQGFWKAKNRHYGPISKCLVKGTST